MRLEIPLISTDVKKQEQNLHFYNSSALARILQIIYKRFCQYFGTEQGKSSGSCERKAKKGDLTAQHPGFVR
jgi:hypothetical protein